MSKTEEVRIILQVQVIVEQLNQKPTLFISKNMTEERTNIIKDYNFKCLRDMREYGNRTKLEIIFGLQDLSTRVMEPNLRVAGNIPESGSY